ncbi:MAG: DUF262 domain-containing protein [Bacteroidales bacterium]|nr:DUF262 domain-containing protein [Bacteroidales bacterium]
MSSTAYLNAKLVGEITGKFVIKSYQRGYRWEESQVLAMLNDIYSNGNNPYCLQPIVVRRLEGEDTFELIDGQQRLTTLLILLKYIQKEYKPRVNIQYTLSYETREKTAEFLENITPEGAENNIDFFYIRKAYLTIDNWFKSLAAKNNKDIEAADDMFGYLNKNVKVIWYEVNEDVDPIALFARLNIGKIALTNAELVKALFLMNAGEAGQNHQKQIEMSIQWDEIEHSLHEKSDEFWFFLTRTNPIKYPTRIELLFDFLSGKKKEEKEAFYTFFYFEQLIKEEGIEKVWLMIQNAYLQLKEWYTESLYYHKIGYLIASGAQEMPDILSIAKDKRKKDFMAVLDQSIADSIRTDKAYKDLSYDKDYAMISKLLLLFNVQSIIVSQSTQRFPFSQYNTSEWSLEHIHAQQSEGLRTTENRIDWLKNHIDYVRKSSKDFDKEGLISRMQEAIDKNLVTQAEFDSMAADAFAALSEDDDTRYVDLISNMALLSREINSKLNNSVFAVKRDAIIELDKKGAFIPYCTKMVFLKYYTNSTATQFEYWSSADRDAYTTAMGEILRPYFNLIETTF